MAVFFFCRQLTEQKPPSIVNLFEVSSPFIKQLIYVSLGDNNNNNNFIDPYT